jgi:SAM-dependent methyltransferase
VDRSVRMFGQAREYEPFMGRWSRKLAPLLVEFAGVQDGESILDVGSGTGVLASAIAAAKPSAQIVGIDPSPGYVATARTQARHERVRYLVGDAQTLDFADDTFHRTISQLVLNFVPDPAKAVAEQVRVTRVGGVVAAAVWDYGDGMQMLRTFWEEAVALDPGAAARDERTMPLSRHSELSSLWLAQGLLAVGERPLTIEQRFESFDDFWRPFLGGQGPAGGHVAALTPPAREALQARLRRRFFDGQPEGPFALEARAWAVKGYVPPRPTRTPWAIDRQRDQRR